MQLQIRLGLVSDRKVLQLQAAAEDASTASGRWFSADIDLRTALTGLSMLVTLVGCYFGLQVSIGRLDAQIAAQQHQIDELKSSVVPRPEYQSSLQQIGERLRDLQLLTQQQTHTIQLGRGGRQ